MSTNSDQTRERDTSRAAELYIDLLKKTLLFSMWEDPGKPVESVSYRLPFPLRHLAIGGAKLLAKARLRMVVLRDMEQEMRVPGSTWPACAHTMVSPARLNNVQEAVQTVLNEDVPGDLIETGVWRGGSCILMRGILAAFGDKTRRVFVADSFEGLPAPNVDKYPADAGDKHHLFNSLAISKEEVENNFRKFGLLDSRVVFLKGWFKDTLPKAPIDKLALMRLDGDMYESTIDALENLYDKLSVGGFCIIDDYGLAGCKAATEDFRGRRGVSDPLVEIDYYGRFWRKSKAG